MINVIISAATAFNLFCVGTVKTVSNKDLIKVESYHRSYRVDLAAAKICSGVCNDLRDFTYFEPYSVMLEMWFAAFEPGGGTAGEHAMLNFKTGEHRIVGHSNTRHARSTETFGLATCQKRPFSGFPKVEPDKAAR